MSDLAVYIRKNHIEVVNLKDTRVAAGSASFTTTRLLVGDFVQAEGLLRRLIDDVRSNGLFAAKPRLIIQPLEMTQRGLSMIEERIFLELGTGAGARYVKLHVGERLSAQAAIAVLEIRV